MYHRNTTIHWSDRGEGVVGGQGEAFWLSGKYYNLCLSSIFLAPSFYFLFIFIFLLWDRLLLFFSFLNSLSFSCFYSATHYPILVHLFSCYFHFSFPYRLIRIIKVNESGWGRKGEAHLYHLSPLIHFLTSTTSTLTFFPWHSIKVMQVNWAASEAWRDVMSGGKI